eukprot:EG_transcript_61879
MDFYMRLQMKLIDMEKRGEYPGQKYVEENKIRSEIQRNMIISLIGWAVACKFGLNALRRHTAYFQSSWWYFLALPLGSNWLVRHQMAQFFPRLSEAPHSLVCEEVC